MLAALLLAGCQPALRNAGGPPAPIETDQERYVLRPAAVGHQATLVVRFTAPADTGVYVLHCNGAISWGLQRQVGDRWVDAWAAVTNACLSPPIHVPPGGVLAETLTVVSRTDVVPDPGPIRHSIEPGTYRVVWHNVLTSFDGNARPFGPDLPLERRVSGPITIARAP